MQRGAISIFLFMKGRHRILIVVLLVGLLAGPAASAGTFSILTYNVGLLRFLGFDFVPQVGARGRRLPEKLAQLVRAESPRIILLEEVWEASHAKAASDALASLGYQVVRPPERSWMGISSGLLLAVRLPLRVVEWSFTAFAEATFMDSLTRKGVLQAVVEDPSEGGMSFAIVGAHTVAVDTVNGVPSDQKQLAVHEAQLRQLISALEEVSQEGSMPTIILGDFNVGPGYADANYRMLAGLAGVSDAAAVVPSAGTLITWDPENPLVKYGRYPHEPPARIDLVLFRDGSSSAGFEPTAVSLVFVNPVEGLLLRPSGAADPVETPLSDHYGVLVEADFLARR